MAKTKLKKYSLFICAFFAVIAAVVLRQIGFRADVALNWFCKIARPLIYIVLFTVWGVSVRRRIIQPQVRRYLTFVSVLMVFWITVRTVRYVFAEDPTLLRYLWYMYYLPMLFIPFLIVLIAMSLGKPEQYRLPKLTALLFIPTAALLLLVLTNDFHQLVFVFPSEAAVWGNDYHYAIGYYLVLSLIILCALTAFVTMLIKCRVPNSRKFLLTPVIPLIMALIYGVSYIARVPWLNTVAGDMTVVFCLLFASALECCIQCGLIRANTNYRELFDASTVGAQITDNDYNVILTSVSAKTVDAETLRSTGQGPVMLEGGIRLSGAPLKNGYVVWTEDMSPLIRVLEELEEAKENLKDNNDILEEEHLLKAREAHIAEQERLYTVIQRETAKQICMMDEMIEQVEKAETDEKRIHLLKKMLVIGAYLKRRSNLVFLADKSSVLEAKEIALSIEESINNLETFGVVCGFISELTEPVLAIQVIMIYDFFEEITERSLESMHSMMIHLSIRSGELICAVDTDSKADCSALASDTVTAEQDEDGEWKLTLRFDLGGNEH